GYEASTWFGVGAPKNTSSQIIGKLNKEINAGRSAAYEISSISTAVFDAPPSAGPETWKTYFNRPMTRQLIEALHKREETKAKENMPAVKKEKSEGRGKVQRKRATAMTIARRQSPPDFDG